MQSRNPSKGHLLRWGTSNLFFFWCKFPVRNCVPFESLQCCCAHRQYVGVRSSKSAQPPLVPCNPNQIVRFGDVSARSSQLSSGGDNISGREAPARSDEAQIKACDGRMPLRHFGRGLGLSFRSAVCFSSPRLKEASFSHGFYCRRSRRCQRARGGRRRRTCVKTRVGEVKSEFS